MMKKIFGTFLVVLMLSSAAQAQTDIRGAWNFTVADNLHHLILQNGFIVHTVQQGDKFLMTRGGSYSVKKDTIYTQVLFDSSDSSEVGQSINIPFSVSGDFLVLNLPEGRADFKQLDNGKAPLAGVWQISGRLGGDGKIAPIHQTGTRQTYKILTGTKFQWVAIDPGKKLFSGTGGGTYTFKDGKYTEKIEFFSRDNSRVGASLVFDGKLEDGKWHHSGMSSKGDKIYEVWSRSNN
ncbi:MAG: membrane or secreted protein [Pedobacter sp.]|nr:MAG: membrane or secreted protein [Pedobacter sp.]